MSNALPDTLRAKIRRGRDLDLEIKAKSEELKLIKGELAKLGAGEHVGTDGAVALVIYPAPSIKPSEETVDSLKGKLEAGVFRKLFDRLVLYKPKKGFREIAGALLSHRESEEVIGVCEVENSPQVRFS